MPRTAESGFPAYSRWRPIGDMTKNEMLDRLYDLDFIIRMSDGGDMTLTLFNHTETYHVDENDCAQLYRKISSDYSSELELCRGISENMRGNRMAFSYLAYTWLGLLALSLIAAFIAAMILSIHG